MLLLLLPVHPTSCIVPTFYQVLLDSLTVDCLCVSPAARVCLLAAMRMRSAAVAAVATGELLTAGEQQENIIYCCGAKSNPSAEAACALEQPALGCWWPRGQAIVGIALA